MRHEPLLATVSSESIRRMAEGDFDAMCTASVAWSFATLGCSEDALWDALASHVRRRVASCKTQVGASELYIYRGLLRAL